MGNILSVFRLVYKLYFAVCYILSAIVLYPWFYYYLVRNDHQERAFALMRKWAKFLIRIIGIRIKIDYEAELPAKPYVICANHTSYLDIIVMYEIIPDFFLFLGKSDLQKWPFIRVFFRAMNIPVHRNKGFKAGKALEPAAAGLKAGKCIAIFPEGQIHEEVPKLHRFKNGAFKLAIDQQVPIVPITYLTNYRRFSYHTDLFGYSSPGYSKIIIHKPISPNAEEDLVHLRERTFTVIDNALKDYADNGRNSR